MEKSKTVNPNWMNDTYEKVLRVASKMFKWNSVYFFEKLNEFLDEFDKIEGFMANDNLFKKVKEMPHEWNKLFEEILFTRLFGPKKYLPIYFENMKLCSSIGVRKPMAEKHFFALWYMMTVNPTKIPRNNSVHIFHVKSEVSYFMSFKMDDEIIDVRLKRTDGVWHCYAHRSTFEPHYFNGEFLYFTEKT